MNEQVDKQITLSPVATALTRRDLYALGLYSLLGLSAVVVAILLWRLPLPIIRTFESARQPLPLFQIFVFCASVALIVGGAIELRKRKGASVAEIAPVILLLLVGFHYLIFMRQNSARSWDYECYERAAQAIVAGANPYGDCYLYWPFVAQTLAGVQQFGALAVSAFGTARITDVGQLWDLVFYLYEAMQFLLILLAWFLSYRFARTLGLSMLLAGGLVTALFVFSNPLVATVKYNQVNLWVLNLVLAAILLLRTHPLLSGLAVALGGHIKLYPLILLLPWTLTRQVRAVVSASVSLLAIVLLQTGGGRDWQLWTQFLGFVDSFPKGQFYRDNSLHSVIYNVVTQAGNLAGINPNRLQSLIELLFGGAVLLILGYFLVRFVVRERAYRSGLQSSNQQAAPDQPETIYRFYGHAMDALALGLLTSPVVWEHHYVLAIPIAIWAITTQGTKHPWSVGIATFLIFAIPTFDVFPLSYHRLLGLLVLVQLTWPATLALPILGENEPHVPLVPDALVANRQ